MIIDVQNVTKYFKKTKALDAISLRLEPGIHGLLGPNGAGKTTLMRILATILDADSGEIHSENGYDWKQPIPVKRTLGYLPQSFGMYKFLTTEEALKSVAVFKNLPPSEQEAQIALAMERANLTQYAKRRVGQLSGGMLRRLGIAQALLGEPELLILDEPSVGLDPTERIHFRKLLRKYGDDQRIILLSSHIVGDVESLCDTVTIMNEGRICACGSLQEIQAMAKGKIVTRTVSPTVFNQLEGTRTVINFTVSGEGYQVRYLAGDGEVGNVEYPTLEDSYTYIIQRDKA